MKPRYEGKNAVVVGGAGGIGSQIVLGLLKEGAKVVVGDRDQSTFEKVKADFIEQLPDIDVANDLLFFAMDVTKEEDHEAFIKFAVDNFGSVDVAFNVAGSSKCGTIDEGKVEDYRFTVDICYYGTYFGMRHQIRQMRKNGGGNILNISSNNAWAPMWGDAAYSSAKNAVITLTQTAVVENTKYNIRCNAVLPGITNTKMTRAWLEHPIIGEKFRERVPMHRPAEPNEIAAAALFLNSDEASYITGSTLNVDGGWSSAAYPDFIDVLENDHSLWEL